MGHGGGFSADGSVRIEAADLAGRRASGCATAPGHRSPWTGYASFTASTSSTTRRSGPRQLQPAAPDAARAARPSRRPGAATAHPPPRLLRRASANGRSRETSAATATVRSWPVTATDPCPSSGCSPSTPARARIDRASFRRVGTGLECRSGGAKLHRGCSSGPSRRSTTRAKQVFVVGRGRRGEAESAGEDVHLSVPVDCRPRCPSLPPRVRVQFRAHTAHTPPIQNVGGTCVRRFYF